MKLWLSQRALPRYGWTSREQLTSLSPLPARSRVQLRFLIQRQP
jgi:hypothetical protein